MKITIEKNLVQVCPENENETADVERLWRMLVDCNGQSLKLAPVGEYVPTKENAATFYVEGLEADASAPAEGVVMDHDGRVCCFVCNKFIDLKKGDRSPLCCGKPMEVMD
jgi:hypothetical protein